MKVSVIGAGGVGSLTAMRVVEAGLADVVLVDIREEFAQARAKDISHSLSIAGRSAKKISAATNYDQIQNSHIVIITAGESRKPGMSRDDLLLKNSEIVRKVSENVKIFAPHSIIIMVTNPLDLMAYLAYKISGFPVNRVIGMAGGLDSGRLTNFISRELNIDAAKIRTKILGSHGDSMVPLIRHSTVNGAPLTQLLPGEKIDRLIRQTRKAGAEIVALLKNASASFGPSQAVLSIVKAIINDTKEEMYVSSYLDGPYGINGIFIGVPAKIGREGIEEIVELELNKEEREAFNASAKIIKESLIKIKNIRID